VSLSPLNATFYHGLGAAHLIAEQYDSAITSFERALTFDRNESTRDHLARAYFARGHYRELIALYIDADPPLSAEASLRLARAHLALAQPAEASMHFSAALSAGIASFAVYIAYGDALFDAGQYTEASAAYAEALRLDPTNAAAYNNLGVIYGWCGNLRSCLDALRESTRLQPQSSEAHSNLLLALHYPSGVAPADIFRAHVHWGTLAPNVPAMPHTRGPEARDRGLRVGYISQDFRGHSVAAFCDSILRSYDPGIEVVCYSHTVQEDAVTARFRRLCTLWRDIRGLNDEAAAQRIAADQIDVLVDLAGHTGGNRLGIFSWHAAPVQATYLGYPGTTGHPCIEYRITDSIADPAGATEQFHTEMLVRLDPCFLCYQPATNAPDVTDLPALNAGHLTLGCFNHLPKLSDQTLSTWARILDRLPQSRLLLKCRSFSDAGVRAMFSRRAKEFGIDMARVQQCPFVPGFAAHLELYNNVDIALDPFPYNGTTTTCEALWMGVPVIALAGETHVSRVGASLLSVLELHQYVTDSEDGYVEAVCRLGTDLAALRAMRKSLRSAVHHSPLTDGRAFHDRLAAVYRRLYASAF
jgi:predicted O-linked N-acetylglucosamine transferase (SPINDLY family)